MILFIISVFKSIKFTPADLNVTIEPHEHSTGELRHVYTGRWSVFNDPNLDQSIIPDDEDEREGLRVGLLVTYWINQKSGSRYIIAGKLDNLKLISYYHTHHANQIQPLLVCQPLQFVGSPMFYFCTNYTKEDIEKRDRRGSFSYILEYQREEFLAHIVILPCIMLIGIFGDSFIFVTFHFTSTIIFLKALH